MRQLMLKYLLPATLLLCFMISMVYTPADTAYAKTSGNIQHVIDDAGLLSTSEMENLEALCTKFSTKNDIDIIILTHNDESSVDGDIYIENFIDSKQYLDSVVLLVDMIRRDVIVQGYGIVEKKIPSSKAQALTEEVAPYLSDGDYEDAFVTYINESDHYMNYVPIYLNPLFQLLVAFLIGGITVAIMAYNAGGKITVSGNTYMDSSNSGLIGRRDDYIRTHVTRVRKPQNNGGGGGGVSAGGLSHSSGRSKF